MRKHEEFCIENEEICIENEEFCIQNDDMCRTAACVAYACGKGEPPITTGESRAALRSVFAGYAAAASGMTQRVAVLQRLDLH